MHAHTRVPENKRSHPIESFRQELLTQVELLDHLPVAVDFLILQII